MYEKQNDHVAEPFMTSGGTRTYVVSEPETTLKYFQIPSGAHLTSAPHVKSASTDEGERGNAQAFYASGESGVLPGEGKRMGRHGPSAVVTAGMVGAWRTRRKS